MNVVTLVGNVGQDPELRETRSGASVANLNLATDRWSKIDGDQKKHTDWHHLSFYGHLAEFVYDQIRQGDKLAVTGHLQYTHKHHKEYSDVKLKLPQVFCHTMEIINRKDDDYDEDDL